MKTILITGLVFLLTVLFVPFTSAGEPGQSIFSEFSSALDDDEVWEDWDDGKEPNLIGKDFVRLGEKQTVSGILLYEDGEWLIQTESGLLYEAHLGNHDHQEKIGLDLQEGQEARIYGFVYFDDIAVVSLSINDKTYNFRTEDGSPLWAQSRMGSERLYQNRFRLEDENSI